MDFHPDGSLQYTIELPDRRQIMNLTYSVSGDVIVSNQPSSAGEERTRFALGADGKLELNHDGARSWYERVK